MAEMSISDRPALAPLGTVGSGTVGPGTIGPGTIGPGTTALLTDRYELTMLEAALRSGRAASPATFEVFTRRLPDRRPWGVFAGLGRLVEAIEGFRFGRPELAWLERNSVVNAATLEWLSTYRFGGTFDGYREGELYTAGSPVLTVEGTFGESVLLETIVLSILNFDSAVAAAASLITSAAGQRPVIEMGSRRIDPSAAVAAARAAYLAGFASTSNLEAGRVYGIPTAGTASHAFVLAFPTEKEAFQAQIEAFGRSTTLLVDTYDVDQGIRNAVEVAGPALGAVRIDSGDLGGEAVRARALLDELGAAQTRLVVTGDLDAHTIAALGAAPVDSYGVGANVVTGMGVPSAGFVYKLVAIGEPGASADDPQTPVAKRSPGKASFGGRKWAWRALLDDPPGRGEAGAPAAAGPVWADVVSTAPDCPGPGARALQVRAIEGGVPVNRTSLQDARAFHAEVRASIGANRPLLLDRR
jgi:nicotinate phosphoribosyltransferase